jgi:hypothetical protein
MMKICYLPVIILVMAIITGCSSNLNTIMPPEPDSTVAQEQISKSDLPNDRGIFGVWRVEINPDSLTADLTPARNSLTREVMAIGDIYDSDLSQFLTVSPCENCLDINGIYVDGYDSLNVKFRMRHPFTNITARPDLHGFDVRLILITEGTQNTYDDLNLMLPNGTEEPVGGSFYFLLNADGFTSHHDQLPSDTKYFMQGADVAGNVNPFLRFFDDFSTPAFNPAVPAGYNVMPVGNTVYERTAVFNSYLTSSPGVVFYAVADVCYGVSAKFSNRNSPQYYLPSFNRTEPWRVEYWIENNNLNWQNPTSTADVVIQVFDWQHNATVDAGYPNASNLSGIRQSSKAKRLELSNPSMQDGLLTTETSLGGTGTPTDPLLYKLTVMNQKTAGLVAYALLQVKDELYGQAAPNGRLPIPNSPAGFPYATLDIRDYSVYKMICINIPDGLPNTSFNHELEITDTDRFISNDQTLEPTFFMDPSHKLFLYEWDFNYDGFTFDVDGTGLPSPSVTYMNQGRQRVALRVTTTSVPPRVYLYDFDVYRNTEQFLKKLDPYGQNHYSTSYRRGNAVAMTSQNYYVAFTYEASGQRDIYLAVGDQNGNFSINQVTNNTDVCYDPAMYVIEGGAHEGVYIVYTVAGNPTQFALYSTYGNLDGSGFSPSNIELVNPSPAQMEIDPALTYYNDNLILFYGRSPNGSDFQIYKSSSSDYGLTWNDNGAVDASSNFEFNPATAQDTQNGVRVVWEDWRNLLTTGVDLYMAGGDGITMWPPERISPTMELTHEFAPSITMNTWQTIVAYLSNPNGSSDRTVHVRIDPAYSEGFTDCAVKEGATGIHTQPSVAIAEGSKNRFMVVYGSYNDTTNQLDAIALEMITFDGMSGAFTEYAHHYQTAGSIVPGGADIFPSVTARPVLNGRAIEYFSAWRNFTDGAIQSPISPQIYFGNIEVYDSFGGGSL